MDQHGQDYDLLVVGGGINGAGIARDAAGRGLRVLLVEKGDLGGATSSASSKLIHGGLRYLEFYEFRLVREALAEREVLLSLAPHIIWPMRFVLPHRPEMRPRWMIRAGLFLYDHLARRRSLPGTESLDFASHPYGQPLSSRLAHGFAYSDCWVEDARLVVLNARDAARRGATIRVGTALAEARREGGRWVARLALDDGGTETVAVRALVNAAGPWVMGVLDAAGAKPRERIRLTKGSHIVVPRLYEGEQAYILQTDDKRVVFVIPYEGRFSLIGTTDVPYDGDPAAAAIDAAETEYLCAEVSRQFRAPVSPGQVVWSYAGVRPLHDDGAVAAAAVTRDYAFDLDAPAGEAPALSVFGGKITTYRRLAEHAMQKLAPLLGAGTTSWTGREPLPGGDLGGLGFDAWLAEMARQYGWLPAPLLRRLARAYGSELPALLGDARAMADMGEDLGGGLTAREIAWLMSEEWARTAEDMLWRRSKLGLHAPPGTAQRLALWLAERPAAG
ncbi:MAG: glycerol-3-phosphate dehydrogenase [Alphaproteobacteria bacterium]|nr:glycerol-3-phosphate dehydrogenase [Alphaproteobacteria bacterium]